MTKGGRDNLVPSIHIAHLLYSADLSGKTLLLLCECVAISLQRLLLGFKRVTKIFQDLLKDWRAVVECKDCFVHVRAIKL